MNARAPTAPFWVRTTVLPDGAAVRTFTDITERKRNELEMANARDAAQAGVRARTEFLAIMSHELRTPINGIIGAAGLLGDMRLDQEQQGYVRVIRQSSDHLSSLVQNILDFSRLDAGRLELEEIPFDPRDLVLGTIAMLGGEARARSLTLTATTEPEVPDLVTGDPSRLRQILVNLVGNAIKFTTTGGVSVATRLIASDDDLVTLSIAVTDSGIGIDPDSQRNCFPRSSRWIVRFRAALAAPGWVWRYARHLVTLMGGTIAVESEPGLGCTFRFSIQLRRAAASTSPKPAGHAAPTTSRRPEDPARRGQSDQSSGRHAHADPDGTRGRCRGRRRAGDRRGQGRRLRRDPDGHDDARGRRTGRDKNDPRRSAAAVPYFDRWPDRQRAAFGSRGVRGGRHERVRDQTRHAGAVARGRRAALRPRTGRREPSVLGSTYRFWTRRSSIISRESLTRIASPR